MSRILHGFTKYKLIFWHNNLETANSVPDFQWMLITTVLKTNVCHVKFMSQVKATLRMLLLYCSNSRAKDGQRYENPSHTMISHLWFVGGPNFEPWFAGGPNGDDAKSPKERAAKGNEPDCPMSHLQWARCCPSGNSYSACWVLMRMFISMLLSRLKVITYSSHSSAISQHYGAVCCYSCRAFFRRGITRSYVCVRGDDLCQVGVLELKAWLHWFDAGQQHHKDQLQAMQIRKVLGCWHETRIGGCHSQA